MQTLGPVRDLLQVRDITQVAAKGLTTAQIEQLRQFANQLNPGGVEITHPTTTLEDLFVRIVRDNTAAGQSYTSSDA